MAHSVRRGATRGSLRSRCPAVSRRPDYRSPSSSRPPRVMSRHSCARRRGARACCVSPPRPRSSRHRAMLDLKIEGATVIDGTGIPGGRTDLGVRDEPIVAVGDLSRESAGRTVHAAGRVVAPGFIDMHSHSDWRLWANRRAESKIRQGVTTEVVGNCGFSPAPVSDEHLDDLKGFALYLPRGMDFRWRSVGQYLDAFDADGTAVNVVQLVGHGTLRVAAMGFARREPTAGELTTMQRALADAVEAGAWGLSTGLIYAPGSYATTAEIVALARICARRRRTLYASHIRGEGAA